MTLELSGQLRAPWSATSSHCITSRSRCARWHVVGFEALLRWRSPEQAMYRRLCHSDLEETGLIVRWAMGAARGLPVASRLRRA